MYWHELHQHQLTEQLSQEIVRHGALKEELAEWNARVEVEVAREANVVCMTTNGVASRQKLIASMGPKAVPVHSATFSVFLS